MARPWKKNWPYVGRRAKSWIIGFYDHEGVERSRSFPSAALAREWMREYSACERRGPDSLRRFLLDLDAAEANAAEGRAIGEIIELYFECDADPQLPGGLAPATFYGYRNAANCHLLGHPMHNHKHEVVGRARYAVELAAQPAASFNEPHAPRKLREQMRAAGVSPGQVLRAWRVLSSVLSWAAGSHHVPEISTNGCTLANERSSSRRRSVGRGSTGAAARGRRRGSQIPSWALSPKAIEAIRDACLSRVENRDAIYAERDAMIVSLQYGLAGRSQDVFGIRWRSIGDGFAEIVEVISWGKLDEWGKTALSAYRRTAIPQILVDDLERWRSALRRWGHPARDEDFVIPGNLGYKEQGVLDAPTGACHFSANMIRQWVPRCFKKAVEIAAREPALKDILGATPYSMRRGGISLRLRAEDAQTVAKECGTSLQMLDAHYAFAIDDLRRFGPRPVEVEWRAAREARLEPRRAHRDAEGPDLRDAA
jgi:hypothetical protein